MPQNPLFKPLFKASLLNSQLAAWEQPKLDEEQKRIAESWAKTAANSTFLTQNEKPFQGQFLTEVFGRLLGFTAQAGNLANHHLKAETASKETKTAKTPDGRIGFYDENNGATRAVVELKSPGADLDARQSGYGNLTPVDQAFGYLSKFDDCRWVIVSNFITLRLYSRRRGQVHGHEFDLRKLTDEAELKRFLYVLRFEQLLAPEGKSSAIDDLLTESKNLEQQITEEFYAFYKSFRLELFEHLTAQNPVPKSGDRQEHEMWLLEVAQKVLDRVLFVRFCESTGLLPPNVLRKALETEWVGFIRTTRWQQLCGLFDSVDKGNPPLRINGYNGGLFRHDERLTALNIEDEALQGCFQLTDYDFSTDVSVNILGHIFEQSISDLEELHAQIQGLNGVKPGKRKKAGVFYTSETITHFIVSQTIGAVLQQRFDELEAEHQPQAVRGKKKQLAAEIALWEDYQDVLRDLKVLDPACGSGAFLIAAFEYLYREYERTNQRLADLRGGQWELFDLDKLILQNNLFGVDLSSESVEITKLSLWLQTARTDRPLNDLEGNIRMGNSVVAPHEGLSPDLVSTAFDWEAEFPAVFAAGGFDCVIGNPPYVRQEWIAPMKGEFERQFQSFHGTADLYIYFFERGMQLAKPGGRLGFISSGTFNNANFAAPFRKWLPTAGSFVTVVNYGENQPFPDAEMVYPTISVVEKVVEREKPFRFYFMREKVPESITDALDEDGIDCESGVLAHSEWRFQPREVTALFDRLMNVGRPLSDVVEDRIYYGVKTGLNDAFIVDRATRDRLIAEDSGSAEILKKVVRGEDLRPWYVEDEDRWLIFTRRGIEIGNFPAIGRYLEEFRKQLEPKPDSWNKNSQAWPGRKSGSYKWYEIQDSIDYFEEFESTKILWPDIGKLPRFSWDDSGIFVNDKGFVISTQEHANLALLQSRISWFCISQICTPLRLRGGLWQSQCKKQFIQRLPIPKFGHNDRKALAEFAQQATELANSRYQFHQRIRHRISSDLGADPESAKLNQALTSWWHLSFPKFRTEVKKALKAEIPLKERDQWEEALTDWKSEHEKMTSKLITVEESINDRVNHLFGLTAEEAKVLAQHQEKAMIDYPFGSP